MKDWKWAITLATCCGICLTIAASASADFVGVTTVNKNDPDTEFLCTLGNGLGVIEQGFGASGLTVCNVFAAFDNPDNVLLGVGGADLQVYNGAIPDVFFQHHFNSNGSASPPCEFIPIIPDLICDTFITIGFKCGPLPPEEDGTYPDGDFQPAEFQSNGHVVGGWFDLYPSNDQGVAGYYPDLQVLFLQSSVALGMSMSGDIDIFWSESYQGGDVVAEVDVAVECTAQCIAGTICDDGDPCTFNDVCSDDGNCVHGTPIDCSDLDDPCNDGVCNPDTGRCEQVPVPDGTPADDGDACTVNDICVDGAPSSTPVQCPKGQVCDPATGECAEEHDPCECVNGKVTLCHIPPGNPANARTIIIGCAARDKHLAHGDSCGPCVEGNG